MFKLLLLDKLSLSKRALKVKQDVENLYQEELKSGWTVASITSQKGRKLDTVSIQGQARTEELIHEIIDAVLEDRHVVVGLYGMGGIGKTTLLRYANEHFRKTEQFESVIFTTVSATPNFVEIRKQIAKSLGLDHSICQDEDDLKERLFRLLQTRKYILILDDMWEVVDLDEICIPAPTKENGCKILMASRSKAIATRFGIRFVAKDSLQLIQVNKLRPDEAWKLFVQKVGENITSKPAIEPLAKEVLRKCGGLPLAIVVIGGTMSTRETKGEWRDALRELEQSASNLEGMEEVFAILMFSFEKLEQLEQSLFLYCCLFPEDSSFMIKSLVDFATGEETLCGMQELGDMRNKVDVLVGKLRNSSMLEDDVDGRFKMHDVIRELGVWITSSKSNEYHSKFIAKARARITEAAPDDVLEWHKATKISLMQSEIESLPLLPHLCPQLHTLLLQRTRIKDIPQLHFLEQMPTLRILDLSRTRIENLPPSISHLVNLRLLCLRHCYDLQKLPPEIGMLVQLISLDLLGCESLRELPVEMNRLNNLRLLNLRWTFHLERMPHGMLSGLHKLEELDALKSGLKWYTNDIEDLSRLTCLISIKSEGIREITKMKVSHWFKPIAKCMVKLRLRNCDIDPSAMLNLLEDSSEFGKDVNFLSSKGLTCVPTRGCTRLTIQGCPDLKTLLVAEEAEMNAFESLQDLVLDSVFEFETLCIGVPQTGCFSNLEKIKIQRCPNLKVLFTNGVTRLLKELRFLHVHLCSQLVNLISELTTICHFDLNWSSLSTVFVDNCPRLEREGLPFRSAIVSIIEKESVSLFLFFTASNHYMLCIIIQKVLV
ncbi:disease resistance protein RPS2-like [Macadamia integrifolia]|uniref:disease resistance protein RPS2-like n=1 Tax=Macadamia integrifolia TaxID=60698 RepID=UPI001C4F0A02|nr:disease resistance protein RPS2-like [Macadamia integrifolia]